MKSRGEGRGGEGRGGEERGGVERGGETGTGGEGRGAWVTHWEETNAAFSVHVVCGRVLTGRALHRALGGQGRTAGGELWVRCERLQVLCVRDGVSRSRGFQG